MNAAEYFLPPNVYRKINNAEAEAEAAEVRGYLEIEVSRINFITEKSNRTNSNSALFKNPPKSNQKKLQTSVHKNILSSGVAVKIIWWGEQEQSCAKVKSTLSRTTSKAEAAVSSQHRNHKQRSSQQQQQQHQHQHHNYHRSHHKQYQQHNCQRKQQQQKQARHQPSRSQRRTKTQSDKLRYSVRSSLALFLDYLRECPPIEIVATAAQSNNAKASDDTDDNDQVPLGQTQLPLPALLLRKYADNYVNGCNFEYKTKIYALYRHVKSGASSRQVQQQQQLKTGEIQLRFKMLFTTAAPPPPSSRPGPPHALKLPATLLQDHSGKLTSAKATAGWHAAAYQTHHQHATPKSKSEEQLLQECDGKNQTGVKVRPAGKSAEIMDAMKKLDANLAALLAADVVDAMDGVSSKSVDQLNKCLESKDSPLSDLLVDVDKIGQSEACINSEIIEVEQQFELYKRVTDVKLHLEALTLQPAGTERMELCQSEIRPIFTVECQLSNELIKNLPRYDMFNIMQFESEKFQSLTQCTRFGQEAQRAVRLEMDALDNKDALSALGCIHFTVWWREPGTCLNEMLGLGMLRLSELYEASLLEQCKCIAINRRGEHLASLYLKISLLTAHQPIALNGMVADSETGGTDKSKNKTTETCAAASAATNANANNNAAANVGNAGSASPSNNNPELDDANFSAETSKVRLLKGFIYVNETRRLELGTNVACSLVYQPFWQQQPIRIAAGADNAFNLQEQFSIINDEKFLKSVDRHQLLLEIQPLTGIVRLPLHQFFIAYRDATITNHLCKGKLPVISIDGWVPILRNGTSDKIGELKCLLAIGSDAQINHLKQLRGFDRHPALHAIPLDNQTLCSTTDLLDMMQSALDTSPRPHVLMATTAHAPLKPHQPNKLRTFKFSLQIEAAAGLPLNPGAGKSKKSGKRQLSKRFSPNEPPSTYVTFQADACNGQTYKSHEGVVYATNIVSKSITPQWQCKFRVSASVEYLTNPKKLFILKIWKKATIETAQDPQQQPSPLEDAIIGFAALNLNFRAGSLYPGGWYNIVDFNGRVTGGLEVYVQPLEDLNKLLQNCPTSSANIPTTSAEAFSGASMDAVINNFEQTLDLAHINLGQAIKRKFNELEQISQRLRTRLVDVTGEPLAAEFDATTLDNWQPLGLDAEDDDFERDLKTPPPASPPALATSPNSNQNIAEASVAGALQKWSDKEGNIKK